MNQRSSMNQQGIGRGEPLSAGVTALAVALVVVSFAFLLAPLF